MDRVSKDLQMVIHIKECTKTASHQDTVSIIGFLVVFSKETLNKG